MQLFTVQDKNRLFEIREAAEKRALQTISIVSNSRLLESQRTEFSKNLINEVHLVERLLIVEALSESDFGTIQKNFRSMLKATNTLISGLPGTQVSQKLDALRIQGIELLSELSDDVKNIESGVNATVISREGARARDNFARVFADFSIVFRGMMGVAELFGDDTATIGGFSEMSQIVASLGTEELLSIPLREAFATYGESVSDEAWFSMHPESSEKPGEVLTERTANVPFTPAKPANRAVSPLERKFRTIVQKSLLEKAPGAAKLINVNAFIEDLLNKSYDHLSAIFGRFGDLIASDVDVNFLQSVVKKPFSIMGALKSIWDSFTSGHLKTMK